MGERQVSLSSGFGTLDIGDALKLGRGMSGWGLPKVTNQWSEGAGDGRRWRGTRLSGKQIVLPFQIRGADRGAVLATYSLLAQIFAPAAGLVRVTVEVGGSAWYVDGVREDGGDYGWGPEQTDGSTLLVTDILLGAEEPYWSRVDQSSTAFEPSDVDAGLLGDPGSMVGMMLSSTTSLGEVSVTNPGDAPATVVAVAEGPFSKIYLTGPDGEVVTWTGEKLVDESVTIDLALGTAVDELGANVFDGLNDLPEWWELPPGVTIIEVQADDADEGTKITLFWRPRRWVLF